MAAKRVLVVDDEAEILRLCTWILNQEGFAVEATSSGKTAITLLEKEPFDLLVVDIVMPDVDGLTVLRRGRELDPNMTAIVITGYATLDSAVEALQSGARGFVLKPFGIQELTAAVQEALVEQQREQERQRLRAQLPILEIAQALMIEEDLSGMAGRLLEMVTTEIGADRAALLLHDKQTNDLHCIRTMGHPAEMTPQRIAVGQGVLAETLRQGTPLPLADLEELAPAWKEWLEKQDRAATVLVPLRTLKQITGMLVLSRRADHSNFTPSELNLLEIVGGQIAVALENAQLYETVARGKREWEATFDAIKAGIFLTDADMRMVRINQAMAKRLGATPQALTGKPCYEVVCDSSTPPADCYCFQAIADGVPGQFEEEKPHLGGIFQISVYPLSELDNAGVHIFRDITERKQAEEALHWELSLHAALAEVSQVLIDPSFPLQEVTEITLKYAKWLTRSEHGFVSSIDPQTDENVGHTLTEMMGEECQVPGEQRIAFPRGPDGRYPSLWGHTLNTGESFYTNAPSTHESSTGIPAGHIPLRNFLTAPAMIGGEVIGQIGLANADHDYTDRDLDAIRRLAELYALALQRKRGEEALQKGESTLRGIFRTAPIGIGLVTDRVFQWTNNTLHEMVGYSGEELRGKNARILYPSQEEYERVGREKYAEIEERGTGTIETRLRHKDGHIIEILLNSTPLDPADHSSGVIFTAQDITASKRIAEAIKESEARYRALVQFSSDHIFLLDPGGFYLMSNAQVGQFGLEDDASLVGRHLRDVYAPEIGAFYQAQLEQVLATGQAMEFEHSIHQADGEHFHLDTLYPILRNGEIWAVGGICRDITAIKQAEKELRRRNEELAFLNAVATTLAEPRDLVSALQATLDKVLETIQVDGGWVQLIDPLDKKTLSLVAHQGFPANMVPILEETVLGNLATSTVAQTGKPIVADKASVAAWLETAAHQETPLQIFAVVPIRSQDSLLGTLGIFSSKRDELTQQEIQLLTTIGHQIGTTVENARLAQQTSEIEILREVDRLRAELIANVSHELRTPLGLIKASCSSLLVEDIEFDQKTQREILRGIDEETDKLKTIVDNLLDLSQAESGRLHLDIKSADIGQLTRETISTMQRDLSPTQHRFVHAFPPEPLIAAVDARAIERVLRNLLGNAVKYSPEGGTITIHGCREETHLLIAVRDEGIGIPAEELDKIFERFYRIDREETKEVGGVGLGLAVCRSVIEAHGGHIWAESTPQEGSTFYFTLPLEPDREPWR
jgi:PAS domain S-box-containing protein